jgi:alpha-aminoadipate carrier protein LysW
MLQCPLCDADIDVDEDELDEGDALTCDECGADLNVSSLDPLELEAEEDDDDDDDLYSDDDDEEDDDEEEEDW